MNVVTAYLLARRVPRWILIAIGLGIIGTELAIEGFHKRRKHRTPVRDAVLKGTRDYN